MVETLPTDPLVRQPHPVRQVTSLSKYLALALFVTLPFIGAYVGYQFAPVQQITTTVPVPVTNTDAVATNISFQKLSPEVLMFPMIETPQIKFFKRTESEGAIDITFISNSKYEKTNADVMLAGMLEFLPSDFSGEWVGMFTPNAETLNLLPTGEPESLPKYFYISDPGTISVLCENFDCDNYTSGNVYKAEVSFQPNIITYEVFNRGFDSYPKTVTFTDIEIIPPSN